MVALLSADDLARIVDPTCVSADLPGIGGRLRTYLDDFRVWELPAYPADGRIGAHLLFTLEKRGWNSEDALRELARFCRASRGEFGLAGLKDRDAVTTQWISAPHHVADGLDRFAHDAIVLGPRAPHSNKLRRGHLHGNRFHITVRALACAPSIAVARAQAKLDRLAHVGMPNVYGEQRFGRELANIERGLSLLAGRGRSKRAELLTSAAQSALFNLYVALRRERGWWDEVIPGDVLKKVETGGLFVSIDPTADQPRLEAGEVVATGPIFGSRTLAPPLASAAATLEDEVLARAGTSRAALAALGRGVPGTRRPLRIRPVVTRVAVADVEERRDGDASAICLEFELPAGSYATVLLREVMGAAERLGDLPTAPGEV